LLLVEKAVMSQAVEVICPSSRFYGQVDPTVSVNQPTLEYLSSLVRSFVGRR